MVTFNTVCVEFLQHACTQLGDCELHLVVVRGERWIGDRLSVTPERFSSKRPWAPGVGSLYPCESSFSESFGNGLEIP